VIKMLGGKCCGA